MIWKTSIDDIRVTCKKCGKVMIAESSLNDTNCIYVCPGCGEHVNLRVNK